MILRVIKCADMKHLIYRLVTDLKNKSYNWFQNRWRNRHQSMKTIEKTIRHLFRLSWSWITVFKLPSISIYGRVDKVSIVNKTVRSIFQSVAAFKNKLQIHSEHSRKFPTYPLHKKDLNKWHIITEWLWYICILKIDNSPKSLFNINKAYYYI